MENLFEKTFEPFKDLLYHLEESGGISFKDALDLDLDIIKSNLENFEDAIIDQFLNALQNHKSKGSQSFVDQRPGDFVEKTFEPFKDLLYHLEENGGISFKDALDLDFDIIKSNLENFDDAIIDEFINALINYKSNPIEKYFRGKKYFQDDLWCLLNQILEKEKILFLDEILKIPKEKLKKLLLSISKDDQISYKLMLVLELESFFNDLDNNIKKGENELYENIIAVSVQKNIDLRSLYDSLKNKTLDLVMFLSYSDLDQTLPNSFLEFINKNNITLSQLESFSIEELRKHELNDDNIGLLSVALENVKQCSIRNLNFIYLGKAIFNHICLLKLTFKDIEEMNEEEFSKIISSNSMREKILNFFKLKSEFDIFLEQSEIRLPENMDLRALKYQNLNTLKAWKFNDFLKLAPKCGKFFKELMKKLESYDPKNENIVNTEMELLENKLEIAVNEIQRQEKALQEPLQILEPELNKEKSDNLVKDASQFLIPELKKEKSNNPLAEPFQNLEPESIKEKPELILINRSHEDFCNEISDLLKDDILKENPPFLEPEPIREEHIIVKEKKSNEIFDSEILDLLKDQNLNISLLKIKFSEYSNEFPAESQTFYKNNRERLKNLVDFSIEENYMNESIIKIEKSLMDRLSESERKSNRLKIKNTLVCLIDNKDELYETFLFNFGNMKSVQLFMDFIFCLDVCIPLALDKCFPPYIQLIEKYRNNMNIVESLINLFKDLREIKFEEQSITETRNLIKNISEEGQIFLREIYDDYPYLENYIYFDGNDCKAAGSESIQNKCLILLKEYHTKLGSSFFDSALSIDKTLKHIYIQEKNQFEEKYNYEDLEKLIQRLNDECGDIYKIKLIDEYPELSCAKNIQILSTKSLIQLISLLKNEIDPFFFKQVLEKYPKYKNINFQEKKENDETITEILEKIKKNIGYHVLESLYSEFPELRQIRIKSDPNIININHEYSHKDYLDKNYIEFPDCVDEQKNKVLNIDKKEEDLVQKIKGKMHSKNYLLEDIEEKIDIHQSIEEEIIKSLQQKERIEKELIRLMAKKNSIFERAKINIPNMINLLRNLNRIFTSMDSFDKNAVKDFFNVYPEIECIISFPKNEHLLIQEESQTLERLLKSSNDEYNIEDLLEINYLSNNESLLNEIIINAKNRLSVEEKIVKLFFDSIKRKEMFSETLRRIQKVIPKFEITSTNLIEHLLKVSSISLKIMLLNICSRFLSIPFLIKNNDEDERFNLLRDGIKQSYIMITELVFLLEDSCTNLISFSFTKKTTNRPRGKSHILNNFFGRNFLTGDIPRKKTLIEFQFDYHYAQPLKLNIADYHGEANFDTIMNLIPFFNYYILHLRSDEFDEYKEDIDILKSKIKKSHKNFIFIIFIHQENYPKIDIKEEDGFFQIRINSIRIMPETEIRNLKDEIWRIIIKKDSHIDPFYRINSTKNKYLKICENFNSTEYVSNIYDKQIMIEEFEEFVFKFKDDFMDIKLLPFNNTFVDYCEKLKVYKNNYTSMSEKRKIEESKKIDEFREKHKNQPIPEIVNKFYQLLHDDYFLCILYDSSSRLKLKIEEGLSPHLKERNEIIDIINKNKDEAQAESLEKEKNRISEVIKNKSFSFEFIVRELYHISCNGKIDFGKPEKQYFSRLSNHLIKCGQPFEVIDGDNLHYISDFYGDLLTNHKGNVLVVSIMGPQSSGKSTLLNFLFGTQFASSSGRCTRGMYGAIMDIKNHEKYEKLLILDTEGIFSAERNDPLFDRKLTLFCLCISHVTILCNKGDVHKGMTDILKLTSECMKDLKEQKFLNPNVFVVLNALTDINSDKLMLPFQNLNIDLAGVKMLPFAYEMKDVHSDIKVNIPSTSFSQKCLEFRNEILNQYRKNSDQNSYTLQNWFEFSQKMWEKIDKLKNLINYTNIEEMKQDAQLGRLINGYLKQFKKLMSEIDEDNAKLENIVEKEIQDFEIEKFNNISESVYNRLDREVQQFRDEIMKRFEKECEERDISFELMSKNKKLLEMNITRCMEDWKLILSQKLNEIRVKQSRLGDSLLNSELDKLMKENNYQSYDEATSLIYFNKFWDKQIETLRNKSKLNIDVKKEQCYKLIKKHYESFNKLLSGAPELEKQLKKYFNMKDMRIIHEVLNEKELLFFQESKIPDIKLIYDNLKSEKKYFKIPDNLFQEEQKCRYVEIFPAEAFKTEFFLSKHQYQKKTWKTLWLFNEDMSKQEIKDTIKSIFYNVKCEAEIYYIEFDFDDDMVKNYAKKIHESNTSYAKESAIRLMYNEICKRFTVKNSQIFVEPTDIPRFFNKNMLYKYCEGSKENFDFLKTFYKNIMLVRKEVKYSHNLINKYGDMLNWYINPRSNSMNPEKIKKGISFFQQYLNWDNIYKEIFSFILESVYKNNPKIKNLNFVDEVNKFYDACQNNINLGEEIDKNFCLFESDVILKLISKTEELIYNINQELSFFKYQINQETIGIFHEIVMTLFWTIYTVQDFYRDNAILRLNDSNRKCYENFYVSVLTKDSSKTDKNVASIIAKNLYDDIRDKLIKDAQIKFHTDTKVYEKVFETHNSMKYLDELILGGKQNIEVILEFMLNPRERLGKIFEEKWNEKTSDIYNVIQQFWLDEFKGYLEITKALFFKLFKDLTSKNLLMQSNIIFKVIDSDKFTTEKMAQEEFEIQFQKLIVKYIHDSIDGDWNEDKYVIKDDIKVKPAYSLPKIDRISDEFLRNSLKNSLKDKSINNISVFLIEILSILDDYIQYFNIHIPSMIELDLHNLNKKYKDNFIGCYQSCPLCKRKCDQAHTDFNKRHKCSTGHQFKVFGGTRFQNNDPSFISCDMMKDTDDVDYEGSLIKWSEFQLSQPDWDFTCDSSLEKENFIDRNKEIWELIRTDLCDYYDTIKKIKINNIPWCVQKKGAQTNIIGKIHLLLLLDDSGSMNGPSWKALIDAVSSTFKNINQNSLLKSNTKITLIQYSSTAIVTFEEKEVSLDLINLIKFRGGGTEFQPPLSIGYEIIMKTKDSYDQFIVGFMSDGGAAIPSNIIDIINNDQAKIKNKINFNFIMFGEDGSGKKILQEIATKLGGKYTNAITFEDLKASFIEILNVHN